MLWFNRKPVQVINDSVFGQLTLNRRFGWEGMAVSPVNGETISVLVHRTDSSPIDEDRETFLSFTSNYPSLIPFAKLELLKLIQPCLDDPDWEGPNIETAEHLWQMLKLEAASIRPNKTVRVAFGFRDDNVWPDATFTLLVEGNNIKGVSLDD